METIIEVKDVKKSYKRNLLFEHVNMSIEKGKIIGLVGENGSGKSVFFKVLTGLTKPDEGSVYIRGKKNGDKFDFPENVGMLINSPGYIDIYTGFENLKFLASIKSIVDDNDIKEVMKKVGIDPQNDTKVKNYSLGMKQKLGIAQAIMENQDILILDEPFNGLDFKTKAEIFHIIKELQADGTTVLLTSHVFSDIEKLCDDIYMLNDKKIVLITEEIRKMYEEDWCLC